jgi:succinoglycan biosynthesis protein ExoM
MITDAIITVDVCLATFKHPETLQDALQSLANQKLGSIRIRLIVVDNDRDESARATVETFRSTATFDVIYDVEPCQSISMARNRALSHVKADYLAFFDDDEVVPADWIATLLATLLQYKADVVFAPVCGILPPDAPQWAHSIPGFRRPRQKTGTPVKFGATGNVLIRREALGSPMQLFDLAYGLSGGGDTNYFYRLYQMGRQMVWCDEALVSERVRSNRITLKWVRMRGFRSGQTFARLFIRQYAPFRRIAWFFFKFIQLLGALLLLPFARIVSYSFYVRLSVRVMAALGQLSVLFGGAVYEEYRANK